ncbi:hypothetical protein [Cellulomonas sp.]|uniref:hypothetical protein n=1 Tax=Cellulomonas sp. TaxID=40001 RepID=UPI002D700A3F|nr:hypothetical protein [Cellulomonas sp.]HYQ76429.1 hypothetical protein [Cellulomonas sp.]
MTAVAPDAPARPAPAARDLLARGLLAVPDRAPVLLGCLGLAALLGVLLGAFRPVVVLPLAAALAVATWRWVPRAPRPTGAGLAAVAGVLVLGAGWLLVNLRYVAEYVVVNRDPGFLTLKGLWLAGHPSAPVPVGGAAAVDAAVAGASAGTEAWWLQDGHLYAQGNSMLPALLAVQGWLGGERAVLAGNLVIGLVALLAVFAVARAFAGPLWALVPTAALALSLPMLTFTRAAYTEPLTIALLCAGLVVAQGAWRRQGDAAGSRVGPHVLAGALVGAVGAARIDGAVAVVGLALGYLLVGASPLGRRDRRAAVRGALAAIGSGAAMVALGMVDVLRLSPEYVREHSSQLTSLLAATALLLVAAVVVLVLPGGWLGWLRRGLHRRRAVLGRCAAGAALLLGVVLASRPLWWEGRFTDPASGYGYAVQVLQAAAGEPLDAARSYDERTLAWVGWYLGVPAVVLGFAGLAVLARRAVAGRDPASALLVAVLGVAAVFPLVRISITPDQIWAVRRLLPATLPGLLLAGTVALAALAGRWGPGRWPGGWPRVERSARHAPASRAERSTRFHSGPWGVARRVAAGGLALAVVAFPLSTWRPGAAVVELSGRATQAHAVCDELDELAVDRVVWTHSSPFRYLATLRVLCDVEVVEFVTPPTTADLAAVRAAWGGGPVAALSFDPGSYAWTTPPAAPVGGTSSTTLGRTLTGVPRTVDATWSEVWVGLVQDDGTVAPAG